MAGAPQKRGGALYRTLASYQLLRRKAESGKDDPSRMSFEVVTSLGAAREKPALQSLLVVGEGC